MIVYALCTQWCFYFFLNFLSSLDGPTYFFFWIETPCKNKFSPIQQLLMNLKTLYTCMKNLKGSHVCSGMHFLGWNMKKISFLWVFFLKKWIFSPQPSGIHFTRFENVHLDTFIIHKVDFTHWQLKHKHFRRFSGYEKEYFAYFYSYTAFWSSSRVVGCSEHLYCTYAIIPILIRYLTLKWENTYRYSGRRSFKYTIHIGLRRFSDFLVFVWVLYLFQRRRKQNCSKQKHWFIDSTDLRSNLADIIYKWYDNKTKDTKKSRPKINQRRFLCTYCVSHCPKFSALFLYRKWKRMAKRENHAGSSLIYMRVCVCSIVLNTKNRCGGGF